MDEILANTKKYEDLAEKRSVFYKDVDRALDIVNKFIRAKGRILYGGMAIDMNLKLSGHPGIYDPEAIPDYDFMSPDYYNDSNELAVILAKEGFENISSINAIHLTTRKVRVNFMPVADITFIPESIYNTLPTLLVKGIPKMDGIRIIHPDFQRLDIYRALCTPFEKPPGEVILQRTRKDIKRFRMLNRQYPVHQKSDLKESKFLTSTKVKIKVDKKVLQNSVIGGFLAYALMYKYWNEHKTGTAVPKTIIPLDCDIKDTHITLHWPTTWPTPIITVISDDFQNVLDTLKCDKIEYYNKYLDDLRPRTIVCNFPDVRYEIYDNSGRLTPVFAAPDSPNIWLCQSYYILLYFLLKKYEDPANSDLYLNLHNSMLAMISDAETWNFEENSKENKNNGENPLFLTVDQIYGKNNWSPDYIVSTIEKISMLGGHRISLRGPFGFYPEHGDDKSFTWELPDIWNYELFLINGEKRDKPFPPLIDLFKI